MRETLYWKSLSLTPPQLYQKKNVNWKNFIECVKPKEKPFEKTLEDSSITKELWNVSYKWNHREAS